MIYDYKSDEIVQDCIADDLSPIIEDIETEFAKLRRDECIGIYAPSPTAKEILGNLLEYIGETFIQGEAKTELLLDDKNDVLITLWNDGELFVENASYDNNHLVSCEGVINYIYDGFKKSEVDEFAMNGNPILVFGLNDELKSFMELSTGDDGETHGFTQSWIDGYGSYFSRIFYSTDDKLVQSMLHEWKL